MAMSHQGLLEFHEDEWEYDLTEQLDIGLPPEHPLWKMPNLIMTPHISGSALSQNFLPRAYDIFTQNLERFCSGKPLLNELTTAQLQGK